jgi:hypothetical protein
MLAVLALLWAAMLSPLAWAAPAKVLFCTDPNKPFASVVPAELQGSADVGEVVISTNRREGELLLGAAQAAHDRKARLVVDTELWRSALDTPAVQRAAAIAKTVEQLALVREKFPHLRVGLYHKLPVGTGLPEGSYKPADYEALLLEERDALLHLVDFVVVEAYVQDAGTLLSSLALWEKDLLASLAAVERLGYRREVLVLVCNCYVTEGKQKKLWGYLGNRGYANVLDTVRELGHTPLVFNPNGTRGGDGWAVVKALSRN